MTREDARYYLRSSGFSEEQINTIEQALSQECVGSTQKHVGNALDMRCDDAVSREAVITAIQKAQVNFLISSTINFANYKREIQEIIDNVLLAQLNAIDKLPSVTPTQKNTLENMLENTLGDAISRQDAIDAIYEHEFSNWCDKDEVSTILNDLPSVTQKSDKYRKEAKRWKNKWLKARKSGHWIRWYEQKENERCIEHIPHCKCSECGTEYDSYSSRFIKYCNECGARMESEERTE